MAKKKIRIKMRNSKSSELARLYEDDISYYRPWTDDNGDESKSVIYLKSGKEMICEHSVAELDEMLDK